MMKSPGAKVGLLDQIDYGSGDTPRPTSGSYVQIKVAEDRCNSRAKEQERNMLKAHAEKAGRRFVPENAYYDSPGIPMPEIALWNCASLVRYVLAAAFLLGVILVPFVAFGKVHTIPLESNESVKLSLRNCRVAFVKAAEGEASTLSVQHWTFMTTASHFSKSKRVSVKMDYSSRNKFFQCVCTFALREDYTFGSLTIQADGASNIAQAKGAPPLSFTSGRIKVQKAQTYLSDIRPKGRFEFGIVDGITELQFPSAPVAGSEVSITSEGAPVSLSSPFGFQVTAEHAAAEYMVLRGASDANLHNGTNLSATVIAKTGQQGHRLQLHGKEAPFYVLAGDGAMQELWQTEDMKEWRGSGQRSLALLPHSKKELHNAAKWLGESGSSYLVHLRALGPGMPNGMWQVLSTRVLLMFSAEILVLLSAGMLYPATAELDVHFVGNIHARRARKVEDDDEEEEDEHEKESHAANFAGDVYRLLHDALGDQSSGFVAWCPQFGKDQACTLFETSSHHNVGSTTTHERQMQFGDIAIFLLAVLLNLAGTCAVCYTAIRWLEYVAIPWFLKEMRTEAIIEAATHRLQYMPNEAKWRAFAIVVQSPSHGVQLRWTIKSELSHVVDFRFHAEAVDKPHRISFEVNRVHVGTTPGNPYQQEFFIPVWPPEDHKHVTTRDPLRYSHTYKFRINALGVNHRMLLESVWTAPLQIDPPLTLSDFPFILQKVFFPSSLNSLPIFTEQQITVKVLETKLALCRLYIDVDHQLHERMAKNRRFGERVLAYLEWEDDDDAQVLDEPQELSMGEDAWVMKSDVLTEEELSASHDAQLYMRNVTPLTVVLTRTSGKQRNIVLKVAASTGEPYLVTRFTLQELMARWEMQAQMCREELYLTKKSPALSLLDIGNLSQAQDRLAHTWAKDNHFTRSAELATVSFWAAMSDNDPYPDGPFRWQLFPVSPYSAPTQSSSGPRLRGNLPWARCPIKSICPSEMLLMGTEKLIEFDQDWIDMNGKRHEFGNKMDFELRSASGQEEIREGLRPVATGVDASSKHIFTWRVPYSAKELDGRFIIVCRPSGATEWSHGSLEFFIDRPLLLQDFELSYAAFCRSYKLPMEEVNSSYLAELGLKVIHEPLAVVEGVRAVFPMEQENRGDDALELCSFPKAVIPCHKAIVLEENPIAHRSAIQDVQVIEGASWSGRAWGFDLLLLYNGDRSWATGRNLAGSMCPKRFQKSGEMPFRLLVRSVQEFSWWLFQLSFFLCVPAAAMVLLGLQQYLHVEFNPMYREKLTRTDHTELLSDALIHKESLLHMEDLSLRLSVPLVICSVSIVVTPLVLLYMNFMKDAFPILHDPIAKLMHVISFIVGIVFLFLATTTILWMILGALLDPKNKASVAVMTGAMVMIAHSMSGYLFEQQHKVLKLASTLMEPLLVMQLDEFVRGRPELRGEVEGDAQSKAAGDRKKAEFIRALCGLGTIVKKPVASLADLASTPSQKLTRRPSFAMTSADSDFGDTPGGEDDNKETNMMDVMDGAHGDEEEEDDGQNQLGTMTREKIAFIFNYLLRHMPLPAGVEQSLSDTKALAKMSVDFRDENLRIVLDGGKAMTVDILENMLSVGLSSALMSILQAGEDSKINLVDRERLSEDVVIFFDRELAGLITTHLQSSIDRKLSALLAQISRFFEIMDPQKPDTNERRSALRSLGSLDAKRAEVERDQNYTWPFDLPLVDATGDAIANISLIALLQHFGVIATFDVYKKRSSDCLRVLEPRFEEMYHWCETHVGSTVLRKHDVLKYVRMQIDTVGDGRVDHLWYEELHNLCKEIYLVGEGCPISKDEIDFAWNDETPLRLLMDINRTEDTILSCLMTDGNTGEKKLWKEAFVLMGRQMHVWPEIPFDDTIVEIVKVRGVKQQPNNPNGYCLFTFVPAVQGAEVDAHGRILRGEVFLKKPNPPALDDTRVFSDQDYTFKTFGDLSPAKGFAFLQTKLGDLRAPASETWLHFDWDRDAKEGSGEGIDTSREPPFPGPIRVVLVFYNMDPKRMHAARPWLEEEGWALVEDVVLPQVNEVDTGRWKGFDQPPWYQDQWDGESVYPVHEMRVKTFEADASAKFATDRSCVILRGMASEGLPVLVFLEVQRKQIPDPNSFLDAHQAPFLQSVYFENAWNFYDQHETILATGKAENNWMIGAREDAVELIRSLLLQRFALPGEVADADGRSSTATTTHIMAGTEPEDKNPNIRRLVPEEIEKSHTKEFNRTGHMQPFWLKNIGESFFVEDMDFVQLDAVRHKHYKYVPMKLRGGFPDVRTKPSVKNINFCLQSTIIWQRGQGNATEQLGPNEIVISFKEMTQIDEFGLETFGGKTGDVDPLRFALYGSDADTPPKNESGWTKLFETNFDYPLDEGGEVIRIGTKQDGMVWYREGLMWYRMRGLWFDAFEELLASVNLQMDRQSAWALWRRFLSFKYFPTAKQNPPGLVRVCDICAALLDLMREEPFLSDTTFVEFNSLSRLNLEHHFAKKMYRTICDTTPDYLGAHNLVRWSDFRECLRDHILKCKPYIARPGKSDGEEFRIGGIWFEALYQTVICSMPEVPVRDEVKEHYLSYVSPQSGLVPMDRTYDVIAKLGRPGLKYDSFEEFARKLGLKIKASELLSAFQLIDIDQNFVLGVNELQCGINVLIRQIIPEELLRLCHLNTIQILRATGMTVLGLGVIFLFLLLSFQALGDTKGSWSTSGIQSILAGVAAVCVQAAELKGFKEDQLQDYVLEKLETFMGVAAKRLAARDLHQKDEKKKS